MTNPTPALPTTEPVIRWPAQHLPANAAVFVSNEIVIPCSRQAVWPWLLRAELWPTWYRNAADIHFISHTGPDLRDRTRFRWKTFGLKVTCKVREFEPNARLGWDAHGFGLDAYHAWVLTPLDDGSTHVLTQETQTGWLAKLSHRLAPARMSNQHQLWLEGLSRQAQSGPPPAV